MSKFRKNTPKLRTINNGNTESNSYPNEQWELFCRTVLDAAWSINLTTKQAWLSKPMCDIIGIPYEDRISASSMLSALHPEDRGQLQEYLSGSIESSKLQRRQILRIIRPHDDVRTFVMKCQTYPEHGVAKCLVAGHIEITDITQRLELLELVLNRIPHLVLVKDSKSRFLYVNDAIAKFYGSAKESMYMKTDADYNAKEDQVKKFIADDKRVIETKQSILLEKEVNTDAHGEQHYLSTLKLPLVYPSGDVHVIVIATFIDEVVKLEERLSAQKLRDQRRKQMWHMTGELCHKLNTRIVTLESTVSCIKGADEQDKADAIDALNDLKKLGSGFQRLTQSARITKSHTNLMYIFGKAIPKSRSSNTSVTINSTPWPTVGHHRSEYDLLADEGKLADVFSELYHNSVKYIGENNELKISIQIKLDPPQPPPMRSFGIWPYATSLIILFQDNGTGIPKRLKANLFKPFQSGSPENSGLGLAIIKEIIDSHGGSIQESGSPGTGVKFQIVIPRGL